MLLQYTLYEESYHCTRKRTLFLTTYILKYNATKSTLTAKCQWFHWVHTLCSRSPPWRSLLLRTTALHSWPGWLNSSPGETLWRVTTCNKVHADVIFLFSANSLAFYFQYGFKQWFQTWGWYPTKVARERNKIENIYCISVTQIMLNFLMTFFLFVLFVLFVWTLSPL